MAAFQRGSSEIQLQHAITATVRSYFNRGPGNYATKNLTKRMDGVTFEPQRCQVSQPTAVEQFTDRALRPLIHALALCILSNSEDDENLIVYMHAVSAGFAGPQELFNDVAAKHVLRGAARLAPYAERISPRISEAVRWYNAASHPLTDRRERCHPLHQ